ncbi:MAG: 50S ribosomal protein L18 [Candidatus Poribacteria bacterium]|nr:50S ribosomal protein L18 [Candidatus Poribacteria bacterium]MEC7867682.1 50S ribosomal protein L18 [Candidatus Poribacteria bacterium]
MLNRIKKKQLNLKKRKTRIRGRVYGTEQVPRLVVFRSLKHIYAQVINDAKGTTLTSASTLSPELREALSPEGEKISAAEQVGGLIASKAKECNIESVVFDRGGNLYHGRIAALAEAARKGGLKF